MIPKVNNTLFKNFYGINSTAKKDQVVNPVAHL